MNYRGKDKLAEALMKGLLETPRPKKDEPVISETLAARLAAYQEPQKETVKDISGVSEALKPKKAPWELKLVEEKPAKVLVEAKIAPKKKTIQEIASTVRLNKVEEKPLIINESTDSIAGVLTNQGKRLWRPAKTETLAEKVERLEGQLSLFEEGSHEYLKKIHAGATTKNRDGWSEHVIAHGGKKYRLMTNGVRAQMENYRGHVVPQKKVASLISKLAEEVEPLNELSNDTLKSYVGKFRKSYDDTMDARSKNVTQPALKSGNMGMLSKDKQKELDGYNRKLTNRVRGKDKANSLLKLRDPKSYYAMKEEVLNEETEPKHKFNKVLSKHGYVYKGTHTEKSLGGRDNDFPSHTYEHPKTGGKVHVWQQKGAADSFHSRHKQKNGITAPGAGDTKGQLDRHLDRWNKYNDGWERGGLREDVEQLDELSAETLTKYGDRAWRSKMNAHVDRGGADYLDDDKARKTANRTIGKRERGLALAKAMMKKKES